MKKLTLATTLIVGIVFTACCGRPCWDCGCYNNYSETPCHTSDIILNN